MKRTILGVCLCCVTFSGCSQMNGGGFSLGNALGAGQDLVKAATLSDADVQSMGLQFAKETDQLNPVAPPGSKYSARLKKLVAPYLKEDGLKLNFKAYLVKEPNAVSFPDGSIRVMSGLMDMLTDDELRGVIGHEIGHVKIGHSKAQMRTAYGLSAARKGVATRGNVAGRIAASELGGMVESFMNAQFSQSQEEEADDYGLAFLKKHKYNPRAMVTCLEKLAKLGGEHTMFSTHPAAADRAERIADQIK